MIFILAIVPYTQRLGVILVTKVTPRRSTIFGQWNKMDWVDIWQLMIYTSIIH